MPPEIPGGFLLLAAVMSQNVLISLLESTCRLAIPLVLAGLGGVISERSGVVNIALEGIMLLGAFFSVLGSHLTGSPWAGLGLGLASGLLSAGVLALMSIRFKADQIVTGVALNILAVGLTNYSLFLVFGAAGHSPEVRDFNWEGFGVAALLLVALVHLLLYRTPLGLRIRAVGEHPLAADTVGINVYRIRYGCVLAGGLLAALAGVYLALGPLSSFTREMSAGKGFIALAAVIFGKWTPIGTAAACLLFGFADALQVQLMGKWRLFPPEFQNMFPYVITMVLLAGFIGRSRPPAADGIPYDPTDKR